MTSQGLTSLKSWVHIKTFEFPKPEIKRDRSFSIRTECKSATVKVRRAARSNCNLKTSGKRVEDFDDFPQLPSRSQTMTFEDSFFSIGNEPYGYSISNISKFTLPCPLNSTKKNDSIRIVSLGTDSLPVASLLNLKSPPSYVKKVKTVKRFSKVENNPMKDWVIEESISFGKPAYLMKPKCVIGRKTRFVRNMDKGSKKRVITAWVPQAIPFLSIADS